MGVILDKHHWAGVINSINHIVSLSDDESFKHQRLQAIACEEFSRLIEDNELEKDIALLREQAFQPSKRSDIEPTAYYHFLNAFLALERQVLLDAGFSYEAADDTLGLLANVMVSGEISEPLQGFEEGLRHYQEWVCNGADLDTWHANFASKLKRRKPWEVIKRTVAGVSVLSANAGSASASMVLLGPVGAGPALLATLSLDAGARLWKQAWDGEW